jgi:hypothetical protein
MAAQLGIACLRPRAPPHHQLWGRVQRRYEEASCGTRHLDILCRRRSTHCSSSQSPAPTLRPRSRSSGLVATRQLAAPGRARACCIAIGRSRAQGAGAASVFGVGRAGICPRRSPAAELSAVLRNSSWWAPRSITTRVRLYVVAVRTSTCRPYSCRKFPTAVQSIGLRTQQRIRSTRTVVSIYTRHTKTS